MDIVLYTSQEAGRLLGLHEATLANWRFKGFGPKWSKLGRKVVYRKEDLEAFIESNSHEGRTIKRKGGQS